MAENKLTERLNLIMSLMIMMTLRDVRQTM